MFVSWYIMEGSQSRFSSKILEPGTEAEAAEEHCWPACYSQAVTQLAFLFLNTSKDYLLRGSTTHNGISPPTLIVSQKKMLLHTCLQASLMELFFSVEASSSQMNLSVSSWQKTKLKQKNSCLGWEPQKFCRLDLTQELYKRWFHVWPRIPDLPWE